MNFCDWQTLATEFANLSINSPEFRLLYYYYNLFMGSFEYDGDDEMYETQFEGLTALDKYLFYSIGVAFFKDPVLGVQCLPANFRGDINLVYLPDKWYVIYGGNGKQVELDRDNSVLAFNDYAKVPPVLYIYYYVKKIVELEATTDLNTYQQRTPYVFDIPEEQKKTAELFLTDLNNFSKAIFTRKNGKADKFNKSLNASDVNVLNLGVEFKGLSFEQLINIYHAKILSYIGIESGAAVEKAERLVTSEAESNKAMTQIQAKTRLRCREKALKRVNAMFGTNYSVKAIAPSYTTRREGEQNVNIIDDDNN